jgi:succinate-acetate transporter protein
VWDGAGVIWLLLAIPAYLFCGGITSAVMMHGEVDSTDWAVAAIFVLLWPIYVALAVGAAPAFGIARLSKWWADR